jgi:hypothetical protein
VPSQVILISRMDGRIKPRGCDFPEAW